MFTFKNFFKSQRDRNQTPSPGLIDRDSATKAIATLESHLRELSDTALIRECYKAIGNGEASVTDLCIAEMRIRKFNIKELENLLLFFLSIFCMERLRPSLCSGRFYSFIVVMMQYAFSRRSRSLCSLEMTEKR